VVGFIVGLALFGAVTYLPLFFQIVHGESPTASGLQLLPLLAGMIICSTGSGYVISRTGRYRAFPITGTALITVGILLLSQVGVGAIFSNVLTGNLARHLGAAKLPGSVSSSGITPAILDKLAPALHHGVAAAYAQSIQTVFTIAAPIGAIAFLASW